MRLFSMELRRFRSRRGNLVVLILGVLFLAGMLTTTMVNSHKPTTQELATAEEKADADRAEMQTQREECEAWWRTNPDGDMQRPADGASEHAWEKWNYSLMNGIEECSSIYQASDISADSYLEGVVSFETEAPNQLGFVAAVATVAALLMASSFVGAEWSSGGMTNLLLWQPRRLPIFAAKLGAAVTGGVALAITYGIAHIGGFWLIAKYAGRHGNLDSGWWAQNGDLAFRLFTLVVFASICGATLSMIGRRTIATIGIVLGYAVLCEFGLRGMMMSVSIDIQHWLLSSYLEAWVMDGIGLYGMTGTVGYISGTTGGVVTLLVTAAVVGTAGWLFARRDTT